jgi:hypothetical protein
VREAGERRRDDHDVFYDAPDPRTQPAGSPTDALVRAVMDAVPEAAEHFLKAAQELLLAAKAVVDVGERMLEQHRPERREPVAVRPASRVRRIDVS